MSSDSGKKCSIEELKERNLPPEHYPTAEEWDNLLAILSALYRLTAEQTDALKRGCSTLGRIISQAEELTKEAKAIRQLLEQREQAGRKKERPRLRLPHISLPRPKPAWLWAIPISVSLLTIWYSGAAIWNNLLKPLSQLLQ